MDIRVLPYAWASLNSLGDAQFPSDMTTNRDVPSGLDDSLAVFVSPHTLTRLKGCHQLVCQMTLYYSTRSMLTEDPNRRVRSQPTIIPQTRNRQELAQGITSIEWTPPGDLSMFMPRVNCYLCLRICSAGPRSRGVALKRLHCIMEWG